MGYEVEFTDDIPIGELYSFFSDYKHYIKRGEIK